jgi:protocatechuate 3,4-dioxygenase beta subunit
MSTKKAEVSRRSFLASAGAGGLLVTRWPNAATAQGTAAATTGALRVPAWDQVPACTASATDGAGQGPFFIHNRERGDDVEIFRQDIRGRYRQDAEPGTEMHLHLRILEAGAANCGASPVSGVEVYVWHTDAQGFYSGFGEPGEQTPDLPYRGRPNQNDLDNTDRFCRGAGVTDAKGVVSVRSIFPGWYNGRDVHIHLMVLRPGSDARGRQTYRGGEHIFTTQIYLEPDLIDRVHKAAEPYRRRTVLDGYAGAILGDERNSSGLRAKASFDGEVVLAQMQILLDPAGSRV